MVHDELRTVSCRRLPQEKLLNDRRGWHAVLKVLKYGMRDEGQGDESENFIGFGPLVRNERRR
jgi:hypothetical protein